MRRWNNWASSHRLIVSLLVVFGYFLAFVLPALLSGQAFGNTIEGATVEGMTATLWPEVRLALSVLAVITVLGWWPKIRMGLPTGPHWFRAIFFAYLLTLVLLAVAVLILGSSDQGMLPVSLVLTIFGTTFLVGLFEELLFRGVLLTGLSSNLGPLAAVVLSSVLFGAMHMVNWVNGQTLGATVIQCLHAAAAGLLYGSLVLRTGSLWPSILLHGLWDGTITLFSAVTTMAEPDATAESTASATAETASSGGDLVFQALFFGYEPLLAIVILFFWARYSRQKGWAVSL